MFERINASIAKNGDRVKSVTVKVKIKTTSTPAGWGTADIQFQEGAVATEYTEHVSEMERVKEKKK